MLYPKFLKAWLLLTGIMLLNIPLSNGQNFIKKFNSVGSFTKLGSTLFFAADDGTTGIELWKTDGTTAGTVLVKDIYPGASSSGVSGLTAFNGKIYFSADDGLNGAELWCSDGTTPGTVMVKNINPLTGSNALTGANNKSSSPTSMTLVGNTLFFIAEDDGATYQLWKTDGTDAGTIKLTSGINSGPGQLTPVGNFLYFTSDSYQRILWKTDGTVAGTHQITLPDVNYSVESLTNINGKLSYVTYNSSSSDRKLYLLDAVNDTPLLLKTFPAVLYQTSPQINNITAFGTGLLFSVQSTDSNGNATEQLWTSDGSANGTTSLKSFSWTPYESGSGMGAFIPYQNNLYFASTNNHYFWKTDGTAAGTTQVSTTVVDPTKAPIVSNQKLYFSAGSQLTSFDGSTVKTEFAQPANPSQLYDVNNKLYFLAANPYSNELWNNDQASELSVTANYLTITNSGTLNIVSKADSAAIVSVTIVNNGTRNLVLSDISASGSSFYVSGKLSQTLAAKSQSSFNLVYFPTQQEILNGILTVKSNDVRNPVFNINLVGTAIGLANKTSTVTAGLSKSIAFTDSLQQFTLSSSVINENQPANTVVGALQVTGGGTYSYSLVSGTGSDDNASFTINNGQLIANNSFDYEQKNTYSIRVQATGSGSSFQKVFIIQIGDLPETSTSTSTCITPAVSLNYTLNDVGYIGSSIIAVGPGGRVIKSDDNGQTWHPVNAGFSGNFTKIIVADTHTAFLLASSNTVLKTEDGGNTWFPLSIPIAYSNLNIYFYSSLIGILYGDAGICTTADGGKTWKKSTYQTGFNTLYSAAFADANNGLICGSASSILKTTDGGNTWSTITQTAVGSSTSFSNVTFTNNTTAYILSSAGDVLQSQDGGITWKRISTIASNGFGTGIKLIFVNPNLGYMINGSTDVFKTTDAGTTWTTSYVPAVGAITGIAVNATNSNICVVGAGSPLGTNSTGHVIALSTDGNTWTTRSAIGQNDFYAASFMDANTGYLFGSYNYKTTDGGLTWQALNITPDSYNKVLNGVFFNSTGYYLNMNSLYKTTDGGSTWTAITANGAQVRNFYFLDANNGFVITDTNLLKTIDGGKTWTNTSVTFTSSLLASTFSRWQFLDNNTGFTAGLGYDIYKTTDGGNTWKTINVTNNSTFILCIHFFDSQNGLVGCTNGTLLRTTDGGTTWTTVLTPMSIWIQYMAFTDNLHGYAVQTNQNQGVCEIYETKDGGKTWVYILQVSQTVTGIFSLNNNTYLTGQGGVIYQLSVPYNTTLNAGYISGPVQSQTFVKNTYSVPAVANASFTSAVSGGQADVSVKGNLVDVTYKQAGNYSIQVTPVATCSAGVGQTLNVTVQDVAKPTITSYYTTGTGASTIITINGTNFNNITAVTIKGTPVANFVVSSPTSISVTVGTMQLGDITVTNAGGTATFSYQAPPVITAVSTLTGVSNEIISITGHDFNNITDVSFGITKAKSFKVNSPTNITAVVANGSAGNISVTNNFGVSNYAGFVFYASPIITSISPANAAPGTTIFILGANFTGVTSVTFGNVVAQTYSGSGGVITAVVPVGASSGAIGVTTPGGTGYYNGFSLIPPPTISAVTTQQNGSTTTITITGTNFTNVNSVQVGSTNATSFTVNSATTITAIISSSATGNITVNTSGGIVSYSTSNPTVAGVLAFDKLPTSFYGDADFAPTVITNNSSVPVVYTSSNSNIAAIVNGMVHIVSAGNVIITASQAGDNTHTAPANVKAPLTINPMLVTAAADSSAKTYGGNDPVFTYKLTAGNLVGSDTFQGALSRAPGENVGTYLINLGTLALNSNYTLTFQSANFKIGKAKLTATANNQTRAVNTSNPTLTISYSGFANGDDTTKLTTIPIATTTANSTSPVGNYPITVSGGLSSNYDFNYVAGTLTITPPPAPVITSINPSTASAGQTVTISGSYFTGASAVSFGGVPAISFTLNSDGSITATLPVALGNGISVTTSSGTGTYNAFNFVPVPVINSSSPSVIAGSNVTLTATPNNSLYSYQWTKDGVDISGANSAVYTATIAGTYLVKISLNGVSQTSQPLTLTSIFILPANNFQITLTGATCKGSINGAVNIKANQHLNYTATITGNGVNTPYLFTDSLQINNLADGTYNICITVANQPNYSQCFTSVISEPKDLSLYALVTPDHSQAILALSGGTTYNISLNGTNYATQNSQFTVPLQKGTNKIIVSTNLQCQGVLEKDITVPIEKIAYPNPFSNMINLYLGDKIIKNAVITINDSGAGKKLYNTQYYNVSGVIQLNLADLQTGVYLLNLSADGAVQVFKIIKK